MHYAADININNDVVAIVRTETNKIRFLSGLKVELEFIMCLCWKGGY